MDIITINVGGTIFEIPRTSLQQFADTRLGELSMDDIEYDAEKTHHFFNRNRENFNFILDYYRDEGELHFPKNMCGAKVKKELEFWKLPLDVLSDCCCKTYYEYDRGSDQLDEIKQLFADKGDDYDDNECRNNRWMTIKKHLWRFLDKPDSSVPAKIFSIFFLVVVLLSVIMYAMGTTSEFRFKLFTDEILWKMKNTSTTPELFKVLDMENPKIKMLYTTAVNPILVYFEWFFLAFFSLELILHFVSSPAKKRFFRNPLNCLDLFLFVSMWGMYSILFIDCGKILFTNKYVGIVFTVLASVMVLRLFRVFRLLIHYRGIGILYLALKSNLKDILHILFGFVSVCIIFGTAIYFAEFSEPTTFPNLFVSIWWAAITMTTVGYGDHYPKSFAGCVVAAFCALCGVMFLAMPVALLASNFAEYFQQHQDRHRFNRNKSGTKKQPDKNKSCTFSLVSHFNHVQ
ncbi:hypothetical protein KUTeg_000730 [Tegillarca granosa]|uniref:BTB domain-containing protein n=1 Tax=Tegillarca granosa TaxID=220873 RepID=A0ABQ9FYH9_TEGGR|nr:hypothetical protein KUTeg_000730 [Tegillarca granosa]